MGFEMKNIKIKNIETKQIVTGNIQQIAQCLKLKESVLKELIKNSNQPVQSKWLIIFNERKEVDQDEIFDLMRDDMTDRQIAAKTIRSYQTIRRYRSIFNKNKNPDSKKSLQTEPKRQKTDNTSKDVVNEWSIFVNSLSAKQFEKLTSAVSLRGN